LEQTRTGPVILYLSQLQKINQFNRPFPNEYPAADEIFDNVLGSKPDTDSDLSGIA
jgi:hypothetical protein